MRHKYDPEIKLDSLGNPDVDYYAKEAERLRAEAIGALFHGLARWLRKILGKGPDRPMRATH